MLVFTPQHHRGVPPLHRAGKSLLQRLDGRRLQEELLLPCMGEQHVSYNTAHIHFRKKIITQKEI